MWAGFDRLNPRYSGLDGLNPRYSGFDGLNPRWAGFDGLNPRWRLNPRLRAALAFDRVVVLCQNYCPNGR